MSDRPAIIITGGARRVGAAMARYFAGHGYDIALHYNHSEADAKKLKAEIEALGSACALFAQNVSDVEAIPTLVEQIRIVMPHCTALINNASIFERAEFMDTDEALFDRQFTINFKAPFFLTQAFARTFGKGCVINILDTDIAQTQGSHFAYLLSKKTLADFTLMAARALGPGVRVNGVSPGIMLPEERYQVYAQKLLQQLPLKASAEPLEIAAAALSLISQPSITGQLLFVDGGKHVL